MKDLINGALEYIPNILIVFGVGLLGFAALKYYLEPWVVETVCRELWRCS